VNKKVRITHPFHPKSGQVFVARFAHKGWKGERVWIENPDGSVTSIPLAWTDLQAPDPYFYVGCGRSPFRIEDLLELADLLKEAGE